MLKYSFSALSIEFDRFRSVQVSHFNLNPFFPGHRALPQTFSTPRCDDDTPLGRRPFLFLRATTRSRTFLPVNRLPGIIAIGAGVLVLGFPHAWFPAHAREDDVVVRGGCVHDAELSGGEEFGEDGPAEGDEGDDEDGEACVCCCCVCEFNDGLK